MVIISKLTVVNKTFHTYYLVGSSKISGRMVYKIEEIGRDYFVTDKTGFRIAKVAVSMPVMVEYQDTESEEKEENFNVV